jgi:hypothetical protein
MLFAEPSGTLTSVRRTQWLNGGAIEIARRLDQSLTFRRRVPLRFEDGHGFIACGDPPLHIGHETPRNTNFDDNRANVSVRLDVFAHLQ